MLCAHDGWPRKSCQARDGIIFAGFLLIVVLECFTPDLRRFTIKIRHACPARPPETNGEPDWKNSWASPTSTATVCT